MVKVIIYRDKNDIVHGFDVSGHAGFSKKGSDIVCAAVSVLVINTINSIDSFTNEKAIVTTDEEKGVIECRFPNRKDGIANSDASLLIKSMILGIEAMEGQYGKYINKKEEAPK